MVKIALDAGHGLKTSGKQTPDGIKEWTLNDKVRDKVANILKDYDASIINTDNDEGNVDETLGSRLAKYQNEGVDVFVSIHHNATIGKWNNATGVETYVDNNPTTADERLADCIQARLAKYTGLRNRGVKRCNFYVINQNKIPAVLVEGGFMDSNIDYKVITSDSGQTAYAKAVAEGLIEFLGLKKKTAEVKSESTIQNGTQATVFKGMKATDVVAKVGPLFTADHKKTGLLASVSMAQFILESGYGASDLAQDANNCFGMKAELSGNTWSGSTWDGDIINQESPEWTGKKYEGKFSDFRKYPNIEASIEDHSAYLLGAMKGSKKRYPGLKGLTDYKKAFQIIKDGDYATAPDYVEKLCSIVEKWNLTQYDVTSVEETKVLYRVQTGSFRNKEYADAMYNKVKDAGFKPYMVKVNGLYKIQVGAYSRKSNADSMSKKLNDAGFYTHITLESGTAVAVSERKTVDELAKEVIQGKWGTGTDRKNRLTKAGYDYDAVQKRVNELL